MNLDIRYFKASIQMYIGSNRDQQLDYSVVIRDLLNQSAIDIVNIRSDLTISLEDTERMVAQRNREIDFLSHLLSAFNNYRDSNNE